jgi:hypothetical protein
MARRIVVLTSDGSSREDGNVYCSRYLVVSSDTLRFDQHIFTRDEHPLRRESPNGVDTNFDGIVAEIRQWGYTVEEPETAYIEVKS